MVWKEDLQIKNLKKVEKFTIYKVRVEGKVGTKNEVGPLPSVIFLVCVRV